MAATSLFICHARPDAAFAEDLAVALETCRLNVWRDTRNRRGGDQLANLYSLVTYAQQQPPQAAMKTLQEFWHLMEKSAPTYLGVA